MLVVETGGYPREGTRVLKEYNGDEENPLHRVGDVAKDLQVNHLLAVTTLTFLPPFCQSLQERVPSG
jgi:hypothetical protein